MRKYLLLLLLCSPAFANSVQIGTLQYVGHSQFQVTITQPWATALEGLPTINGSGPFLQVGNTLFSGAYCKCPILTAGYSVWTPTGKNMFINTGTNLIHIYATTQNLMLAPFQPGDMRSINVTTVPEPSSLILLCTGLLAVGRKMLWS